MNIMIMAQHYAPEDVSGSVLGTELATDLSRRGHNVTFVTCVPNYPDGIPFPGYRNRLLSSEDMDGVRVVRTWSYVSPLKTFWRRMLNYGTFSMTALIGGLYAGKADVILSFSPPLPLGIAAWLLSRLRQCPWILNVMDIYPEVAVATGVLRNKAAIRFFSALEVLLYRRATLVQVLSEGFCRNLRTKGVPQQRLSVIPVWADPEFVVPMPRDNAFRKKYDLSDKFVVMHTGNFGFNNSLDDVVSAAEVLRDDDRLCFVLVGEGERKAHLAARVRAQGLKNVLLLPYQPRESFSEMLAAADIGVVSLSANAHQTSFPSKTFNIMASGRPILVIAPEGSELRDLVEEHACGIGLSPGRPSVLSATLATLPGRRESLDAMGTRGRALLIDKYSRERCVDLYENDLKRVTRQRARVQDA